MIIYDKFGRPLRRAGEMPLRFAQPTLRDVRPVSPVLTNLSIASRNPAFFWDRVAPPAEVAEQSGTYFTYPAGHWMRRTQGAERAPEGTYTRVGYGVSTGTYACVEYGFEKLLGDSIRAGSQTPEDLEELDTLFLTNLIQLELEKLVAADAFVTGVWGTSTTPAATLKWDQYDTSDPIDHAKTAARTIRRATGAKPNRLIVGALAWEYLSEHPLLLDKYKYTQTGILGPAEVGKALDVDELIVAESVEETAAEGAATSPADIWTDNALFLVSNPPGVGVASGAFTFMWNEAGNVPWAVQSYRLEERRGQVTRVFTHADPAIVSSGHGYIYLDVIT